MWCRLVAKYRAWQCCSKLAHEVLPKQETRLENVRYLANQKMVQWGYKVGCVTPDQWKTLYPIADGKNQSPIDIVQEDCIKQGNSELILDYNKDDITYVINSGYSVTFFAEGSGSNLRGGDLANDHRLLQFHFHWGAKDERGSEHTLNGKEFSAEVHLVHINTKYSSFEEALRHEDGLCVIGAFLEASNNGLPSYDHIADIIKKVKYKNQRYDFKGGFDARTLLPEDLTQYTRYCGSLTTPPLSECVQWINLLQPVKISRESLAAFRSLCTTEEGEKEEELSDNYRPPQPMCCRALHYYGH